MRTGGHGNDAWIVLVPIGVLVVISIILYGGPAEALDAINTIVGQTARATIQVLSGLFS